MDKNKLLIQSTLEAIKTLAFNLLAGWLVCLILLYFFADALGLFEVHNYSEFIEQMMFSVQSLALPVLIAPILAMLKFNKVYFSSEEEQI
ncbi:hypothetical protein [Aliiglaciecola sp. M165]|uniref:hypothetical protein n=1 Tax=Aliiglaciecola sp. M165 TaxID=2593649 RepID=UPI00117E5853|nr:hypothetical protein [Aliiglaciecola sp. M165]TRY29786.1 hypothetical protein FM019_16580 [Aliiglaciecola sp. M165]